MKRTLKLLSCDLPVAAYLLAMLAGAGVSPTAQASLGRCKWEGGPGYPTHTSCQKEDCLGDGGLAMCAAPEIRPPLGRSDSQVDGQKFEYRMCDVAPASNPKAARWCAAQGGTWEGSAIGCTNLPSQYPAFTTAANESAALSAANQFMTGGQCPPVLSGDTGWGLADYSENWCWSGAPIYQNGELLRDMRKQSWTAQPQCGGDGDVKYLKTRRLVCPNEYAARTKPNGDLQCFMPQAMCNVHGNPVDCAIGAKLEIQADYRAADGLEFTRYYNSQGRYRPPNSDGSGYLSDSSDYWRHSFSRRLIPVSDNPSLAAVLRTDNGYIVAFDASGAEIFNKNGAANRLESLGASGWRIIKPSSDIEYFDSLGRPTSVITHGGLTTTLGYDGTGQLTTISNDFGRTITLNYTAGALSSITIPGGAQISYAYDELGRLVTVTSADSTTRTYHYEDEDNGWLLTGITDENAVRFSTYTYDAGYVASEEHAGGVNKYSFQIGDPKDENNSSVVIDPLGKSRTFSSFNTNGVHKIQESSAYCPSCPNIATSSFDANGNYAHKTDFNGRRTNHVHELTRNLETSRTEGLSGSGTATAATRTITTEWHPTMRLPTVTRVFAGASATGIPLRVTTMSYDGAGNVLTYTVQDPAANVARTWSNTYDGFGRVLTQDGPRTDVADLTTYVYYQCTYGAECGQLHTVTNALGHVTRYNS